jgi:hypothetical protein
MEIIFYIPLALLFLICDTRPVWFIDPSSTSEVLEQEDVLFLVGGDEKAVKWGGRADLSTMGPL